jgi:hypothetical protein
MECLNAALRSQGQAALPIDRDWIANAEKANKVTLDYLEDELKNAKSAPVKENIRVRPFLHKYLPESLYLF